MDVPSSNHASAIFVGVLKSERPAVGLTLHLASMQILKGPSVSTHLPHNYFFRVASLNEVLHSSADGFASITSSRYSIVA